MINVCRMYRMCIYEKIKIIMYYRYIQMCDQIIIQ